MYCWGWGEWAQLGGAEPTGAASRSGGALPQLVEHPILDQVRSLAPRLPLARAVGPGPLPAWAVPQADAVAVACGSRHTAALTADGRVLTWGWGAHGQLGGGRLCDRAPPAEVALPRAAAALACGAWTTSVVLA